MIKLLCYFRCYYSQARCATPSLHIAYVGPCGAPTTTPRPTTSTATTASTATTTTTVATTATVAVITMAPAGTSPVITATAPTVTDSTTMATTTPDTLLQVFCSTKDTVACSTTLDPVCGTDTNFYLNKCEFFSAKCDNASLVAKDIGFCTTGK